MPLNIDWQQILLHMFNFVILFAALYFILYKPVHDFMVNREETYKKMDEEAKKKASEADLLKAEAEKRLQDIDAEIDSKRMEEERRTKEICDTMIATADKEAKAIVEKAYVRGEKEREAMLKDARNELKDAVYQASERIAMGKGTKDTFDAFLDSVEGNE